MKKAEAQREAKEETRALRASDGRAELVPTRTTVIASVIEAYYVQFGPMVLRRCRRLLRNEEQALDAMHDVFVKLLLKQDQLSVDAPSSFLFRMATNECLNRIRTSNRRPETADDALLSQIAAIDDPESRADARSILAGLFGREKASTREIAVMLLLDRMTLEEVAREMRMSVSGVRKRVRALRAHLLEVTRDED